MPQWRHKALLLPETPYGRAGAGRRSKGGKRDKRPLPGGAWPGQPAGTGAVQRIGIPPWGSHAETPDKADRVVFDLDPGPGVPFAEVRKAATDIRKLLAQLELESFLRVSGGKGLHVVVPLDPGCDWDLTKRFARGFAEALAQSEPQRFVATATKSLRNKRIFVDYLRMARCNGGRVLLAAGQAGGTGGAADCME